MSFNVSAKRIVTPELQQQMNLAQSLILNSGMTSNKVISFKKYINDIEVECAHKKSYTLTHFKTEYIIRQT